jgi:predicted DCC family thiol-disulfide oxidoreductase YuxK
MSNGWTGGQYSLLRVVFGICLTLAFLLGSIGAPSAATTGLLLGSAALSVCFGLGLADRAAALALFCVGALVAMLEPASANPALLAGGGLFAHTCIPENPYGSWDARGRADPGGGWWLPAPTFAALWIALLGGISWIGGQERAGLMLIPLVLFARVRPWLWVAFLGAHIALRPRIDLAEPFSIVEMGLWMLHGLTFDPAWIRASGAGERVRLFYDGGCGLCHAAVRFVLAEDPQGRAFRFAPLASDAFESRVAPEQRAALPDSLVLVLADGRVLVRGAALREIGERLGGLWRLLALASRCVPTRWLDALYDAVARRRARLFAAPTDTCPLIPSELRARFE